MSTHPVSNATPPAKQPVPPEKIPGQPAPDEDKENLPEDGDATNQPAYDKDRLRRIAAD